MKTAGFSSVTDFVLLQCFTWKAMLIQEVQLLHSKMWGALTCNNVYTADLTRVKSKLVSWTENSTWKGATCSLRISRCFISKRLASTCVWNIWCDGQSENKYSGGHSSHLDHSKNHYTWRICLETYFCLCLIGCYLRTVGIYSALYVPILLQL